MDGLLNKQAGTCNARLASGGHDPTYNSLHSVIEVRIVEHDVRRLATQLQSDFLEVLGRRFVDLLTAILAAREGNFRYVRMSHQRLTDFQSVAGHDVYYACREARLFDQPGKLQSGR
ncbi:hypothetical protein D3C87_1263830 [compost metagenome]